MLSASSLVANSVKCLSSAVDPELGSAGRAVYLNHGCACLTGVHNDHCARATPEAPLLRLLLGMQDELSIHGAARLHGERAKGRCALPGLHVVAHHRQLGHRWPQAGDGAGQLGARPVAAAADSGAGTGWGPCCFIQSTVVAVLIPFSAA